MNRATRTNTVTMAVLLALSGIVAHGLFEILQGSTPTGSLFIEAIGPGQRMWVYCAEGAFTVMPTFLLSGILALIIGAAIIVWSGRVQHREMPDKVYSVGTLTDRQVQSFCWERRVVTK